MEPGADLGQGAVLRVENLIVAEPDLQKERLEQGCQMVYFQTQNTNSE
jgi:hypothetical protein